MSEVLMELIKLDGGFDGYASIAYLFMEKNEKTNQLNTTNTTNNKV